jgi:hypothetical protein
VPWSWALTSGLTSSEAKSKPLQAASQLGTTAGYHGEEKRDLSKGICYQLYLLLLANLGSYPSLYHSVLMIL